MMNLHTVQKQRRMLVFRFMEQPLIAAVVTAAAALGSFSGCASKTGPQPLPPQTVTTATAAPEVSLTKPLPPVPTSNRRLADEKEADPSRNAEPAVTDAAASRRSNPGQPLLKPRNDGSLVILGEGDGVPGMTSNRDLVVAARQERERRRGVTPVAVVTDENLAEEAHGGRLTVGNPRQIPAEDLEAARQTLGKYAEEESYWRDRARGIRQQWRDAYDSLDAREEETATLRRRFYAEENAALREREIKPAWDQSQELLVQTRETIENARDELDLLYEDGRRAGALEGWLRSGIELEPWPTEAEPEARPADQAQTLNLRDIEVDKPTDPPPRHE